MLLIEGQAGIGKSRLAAEARRRASDAGMNVLTARGSELEREFPYGVVRQLFEGALVDPAARERLLAGAAAAAAPLFGPEPEDAGEARDASFSTLHGLYWLALNLAGGGSDWRSQVDDLHWCDRPSLRFIAFLLNRLEGHPVIVVGSMRPEEPGADLALAGRPGARPADARDVAHAAVGRRRGAAHPGPPRPPRGPDVRRRVPRRHGRQPAAADGAAARRRERGHRAGGAQRGRRRGPRPSGRPPVRAGAAVAPARRGRRRARGRRDAGGGARGAPHRRARRPGRATPPRAGSACWPAPRSCAPSPRSASSTPWCGRRSTGTSRPASGSGATPWRPGSSARRARRATSSPPSCWRCRRWARTGLRTSSSTPPARRW